MQSDEIVPMPKKYIISSKAEESSVFLTGRSFDPLHSLRMPVCYRQCN